MPNEAPSRPGLTAGARVTLLLIASLSALAVTGLTPVLSQIEAHFAGRPGAASLVRLLVTSVGGAMIVGAPLAGILAERLGQHRLLMLGLLLYAVSGCAGYVLEDLWALLATRVLLGLSAAAVGVLGVAAILNRLEPGMRERWLGFYALAGTVGALILIPAAGVIGSHDWRGVFLLHLIAVPVLGLAALFMPHAFDRPGSAAAAARAAGGPVPVGLTLLGLACGVSASTAVLFLPFHLVAIGQFAPERVAVAMLASTITAGASAFAYGWVRRRLNVVETFALAFSVAGAGIFLVAMSARYGTILFAMGMAGIGIGLLAPNLFAAAAQAAGPERRARYIGFARAGLFGGPLVAQLPLEPLARAAGPAGALLALALFGGAMMVVMLVGRVKWERRAA